MEFVDTISKNMLTGNYCYYNQLTSYAFATDKAMAVDFSQGDSLFIHADTLQMYTFNFNTDSVFREARAYHKVRFYHPTPINFSNIGLKNFSPMAKLW